MGRWRIGWPSGMSQRKTGPRRVMALPSPFLGGDNVTILVSRTYLFPCCFLNSAPPCGLVASFSPLLSRLHTCNSVCQYFALHFSVIMLVRRSHSLLLALCAFFSHSDSSFSFWCVLYTSFPFGLALLSLCVVSCHC
jgi:hypothetical protein